MSTYKKPPHTHMSTTKETNIMMQGLAVSMGELIAIGLILISIYITVAKK